MPRNHCAAPPDPSSGASEECQLVQFRAAPSAHPAFLAVTVVAACRAGERRFGQFHRDRRSVDLVHGIGHVSCLSWGGGCGRCYGTRWPITGNAADHLVRNRQKPRLTCRNARQEISAEWPKSRRFVAGRVVPVTPPAAPRSQAPQHVPDPPGEGRRQLADTPRPAVHRHPLTAPPSASRADTNNPAAPAPMPTARRAADHQSHFAGTGISSSQAPLPRRERQRASRPVKSSVR